MRAQGSYRELTIYWSADSVLDFKKTLLKKKKDTIEIRYFVVVILFFLF